MLDPHPRRPGPGSLDRVLDQPVEPHRPPGLAVELDVAGEIDQVADQHRQLVELGDDVGEQSLALLGRHLLGMGEDLDVGAQAGERRAQLVRGVGDELALGVDRALERVEHRVEAAGQAAQLAAAARVDAATEVAGLGDLASRLAEPGRPG